MIRVTENVSAELELAPLDLKMKPTQALEGGTVVGVANSPSFAGDVEADFSVRAGRNLAILSE